MYVIFLEVKTGYLLHVLKTIRISTSRSKIFTALSCLPPFQELLSLYMGIHLKNGFSSSFIPSVSLTFWVNFNETSYGFYFCLGNFWSKSKPIKLRKYQIFTSVLALLCGNGISDFLGLLPECVDLPFWRRVFRWGSCIWGKHYTDEYSPCSGFCSRSYNETERAGERGDIDFTTYVALLLSQNKKFSWELNFFILLHSKQINLFSEIIRKLVQYVLFVTLSFKNERFLIS